MNIKKIEIVANGFKGANVTYLTPDFKNNRPIINEVVEKRRHPIHIEFEKLFKDLRGHLLNVHNILNNRLSESETKSLILDTDVAYIEFDNDSFVISGEMQVFGEKRVKLKTPKVSLSDEYENYGEVRTIIDSLKTEVQDFLGGLKVVSDEERTIRWIEAGREPGMTKEMFDEMSAVEKMQCIKSISNKKFGDNIEMDEDADDEEEVEDSIVIEESEEEVEIPAKGKKNKKAETSF